MENNYKITEEEAKEALSNPTRMKGMAFKGGFFDGIMAKAGNRAIKLIEEESSRLGFPFEAEKMEDLEWYPAGILTVTFFVLQEKFNFQKKDFADLAEVSVKASPIIKLWMKYFIVPKKIAEIAAAKVWSRYWDRGRVEIHDFQDSKEKGHFFIKIKDFKLHPLHFFYLGYFFLGMTKMTKKFQEVTVEETKSPFRGGEHQEYLIKWKH